ncbi:AlbA family DNA-binding domain-containing protein [Chryseobacterium sp. M5A1_1a]
MEIHKQEHYDFAFIESLINNEIEESINIDFKSADALDKVDKKKTEISKDVSAFANSNGGIIIYGLNESNHKASSISYIDGNIFTKEWLEQIINSTTYRTIPGLKIYPIRNNGGIEKTLYIVQIPESIEAPHMAKDKRYYRRYNFESVFMEEYEVRNMYFKKSKSNLVIDTVRISFDSNEDSNISTFTMEVNIYNAGFIYTDEYKINVIFEPIRCRSFMVYNGINMQKVDITRFPDKTKVSAEPKKSIYPQETQNILRFEFSVNNSDLKEFVSETNVRVTLNFPFGENVLEQLLIDFFKDIE